MNLLFIIPFLFTNVLTKTIATTDVVKIHCDGSYIIQRTTSSRIFIEVKYSNDAPVKLQDYIKKRYHIDTKIENNKTDIIIRKPKTILIYHGKEVKEYIQAIIYLPQKTIMK
tara:strand:+ start:5832 stop:6167 length:336 start_codon:yes stop_codon:yes gene_type:complete